MPGERWVRCFGDDSSGVGRRGGGHGAELSLARHAPQSQNFDPKPTRGHIAAMSPDAPPRLFDRALLRQRQTRARTAAPADFLLARVADDLADRLAAILRHFERGLDLGTPGPHVARALAESGKVAQIMRAAAPENAAPLDLVADEEALPFADASLDLVVSGLALHMVNDLPGALAQIRRALRPDGLFIAALLGGRTLQELRAALAEAESDLTGGASPRVAPFADVRELGGLLQRAGFALPVSDVDVLTVRYADMFALMADLRAMGATNVLVERARKPATRGLFMRAADIYAQRFADPDGRLRATFEIVWLSGWAPHESQQKPLRPGSAKARLADALDVAEIAAGDRPPQ